MRCKTQEGMVRAFRVSKDTLQVEAEDLNATNSLGKAMGIALRSGDVVGLIGDLGAGKTTLARSIVRGAGVPEDVPVNSPTFTILALYAGTRVRIVHLDLYRLSSSEELEETGFSDLMDDRSALIVEWFDRFPTAFPSDALKVQIEITGEKSRRFILHAAGASARDLLESIEPFLLNTSSPPNRRS